MSLGWASGDYYLGGSVIGELMYEWKTSECGH